MTGSQTRNSVYENEEALSLRRCALFGQLVMATSDTNAEQSLTSRPRAERSQLSRRNLTLLLLGVLSFPPTVTAAIYFTLPPAHDRPLRMQSSLTESRGERVLLLTNVDDYALKHVRVELNRAFHYLPRETLAPQQRIEIPLKWFAKKSGHRFEPQTMKPEALRITARLPDHARGVCELDLTGT